MYIVYIFSITDIIDSTDKYLNTTEPSFDFERTIVLQTTYFEKNNSFVNTYPRFSDDN